MARVSLAPWIPSGAEVVDKCKKHGVTRGPRSNAGCCVALKYMQRDPTPQMYSSSTLDFSLRFMNVAHAFIDS